MAGDYLPDHRRRARACKKRAGDRCELCGRPNRMLGVNQRGEPTMWFLHGAHRNQDKHNPTAEYLCLCPACHQAWDRQHREALQQLDRTLRAEITQPAILTTPEGEQALQERHARLLAQEQADMQAARTAGAAQTLSARALWARCKRLSLEVQIARQVVSRLHTGNWRVSRGYQQALTFYRAKRDAYVLALEAYERLMAPLPTPAPPLQQRR